MCASTRPMPTATHATSATDEADATSRALQCSWSGPLVRSDSGTLGRDRPKRVADLVQQVGGREGLLDERDVRIEDLGGAQEPVAVAGHVQDGQPRLPFMQQLG